MKWKVVVVYPALPVRILSGAQLVHKGSGPPSVFSAGHPEAVMPATTAW